MVKVKRALGIVVILALLIGSSAPFLVSTSPAAAQDGEKFQLAPLNPDFLEFVQQPYEPLYGHIPHSMDLSHLRGIPVQREQALRTQPAAFDWRDQGKVTPVRNQDPCGTCWIHGILAAVESRVLIVEDVEYDFSEQNVACCTDPAWVYLIGNRCNGGGWSWLATDVLTKKGTRLEVCDPYDTGTINTDTCNDACTSIKRVTGFRLVASDPDQITEIKNAIYDYGPVSMAYYHNNSYLSGNIYYYPDCTETTNHEVCIVGWDDTVEWPGTPTPGYGAWIVKNSWGTGFGDNGYFYMCYGSGNMEDVISYRYEDCDANQTVYYWDEAGKVDAGGYVAEPKSSAWMASIFTSAQDGNLTHVDFWTTSNNAEYELYVYDGSFGSQLAYQTGSCAELGYYSISLTTPVPMTNGQQFTVAVKMTTPGFNYPLPVEYEITGFCEPPIQTGVCFTRHLDTDLWDDAAGFAGVGVSVCLRAKITTNNPPEVTNVTASQSSPIVNIAYDVSDDEQSEVSISFEYWDGDSWEACTTTTGDGTQTTGTGKSGTWNAKTDFDEHYMTDCKIKVTADDGQAGNNIGVGESNIFTLDTKDPTGYGCSTPTNGATDVSINPDLTCLTASDDSPPISYYFQLAENDTFTLGLQESGWQTSTTWSPSTLDYNKQYFWGVKSKDSYGNEAGYGPTSNFITEPASYDIPLFAGWNLIGLPLIPDSTNIEDILAGISVDGVAAYDGTTQTWYLYSPGVPSDLTEMTHGKGYWVKVTEPCTLAIEGTVPGLPYDIPLFAGWNLIALPLISEPQNIEDVLAGISVDGVAAYDGATQTWYLYSPGVPSDLTEMTHGKGYWVKVSDPCTLTIEGSS